MSFVWFLFGFVSGRSFPVHTMPRFTPKLKLPVKVAVSCCLIVIFIIYHNISYTALPQPSHIPVTDVVRHRGSSPQPVVLSKSPNCPAGFYTKEELKPYLQRPLQDPGAPGADGKAFVPHRMSPEEQKESLDGFEKNKFNQFASDRISLHRDLGNDTRHQEWVHTLFIILMRESVTWHWPVILEWSTVCLFF